MKTFQIASFNLFQYAEPGTFWYEEDEDNDYEPEQWALKQAFIRQVLQEMEADIIGLQEVFSIESLRALLESQGYPHVLVVQEPAFSGPKTDGTKVWKGPVNALASKFPILSSRSLPSTPLIERDGLLSPDFSYRRDIIEAEIDIPGLPKPILVYVCHLKSKGTFVSGKTIAALPEWTERFRAHTEQRALLDANQIIRRAGEAMMLRHTVMSRVAANPDQPVVVLGDLNDDPDSFTLRILTQSEPIGTIAQSKYSKLAAHEKAEWYRWRLYPAYTLGGAQQCGPIPTHVHWSGKSVLDYILVSNALNANNPKAIAPVTDFKVFNQHQLDAAPSLLTSDHAPIRATFQIRTED